MVAESKALTVLMKCDKCNVGNMKQHGNITLATYPQQYPHKCDNCGHVENYNIVYPYQKFVVTEPFREPRKGEV